jgi:hypothetical protein
LYSTNFYQKKINLKDMHQPLGQSETVWCHSHTKTRRTKTHISSMFHSISSMFQNETDNNNTLLSQLHKQHKTLLSSLFSTIIPSLLYVPHNTKRQHNSHLFPLKSSIFISLSLDRSCFRKKGTDKTRPGRRRRQMG